MEDVQAVEGSRTVASEAPSSAEETFLAELDRIDRIVRAIGRRKGLDDARLDDFNSWVRLKLIEADYRVIRRFQGRSSMGSYLAAVISNLYRDFRIQERGKWRPSAAARDGGHDAVRLEALIRRDGHPVDEAIRVLRSRRDVDASDRELHRLASSFPQRSRPTEVGIESADSYAGPRVDVAVDDATHQSVRNVLESTLTDLDAEDQLIIKMKFWSGFKTSEIARALGIEQRPLYRRIEKIMTGLLDSLVEGGVSVEDVRDLLEAGASSV